MSAYHMKCSTCGSTIVKIDAALEWKCPFCEMEKKQCKAVLHDVIKKLDKIELSLHLAEKRASILLSLEQKVDDNMKRLNAMMLELKGIVAMVRPQVKKSGWYGDEIEIDGKQYKISNALKNLE